MSLKQIGTGETPAPLLQLQEINEAKLQELTTLLLKEALAISNEKCNELIATQNTLVGELTESVNELTRQNDGSQWKIRSQVSNAVSEIQSIKSEVSVQVKRRYRLLQMR